MASGIKSQDVLATLLFFIPQYTGMHPTEMHFLTVKLQCMDGRGLRVLTETIQSPGKGSQAEVWGISATCPGIQGLKPNGGTVPCLKRSPCC